MDKLKLSSIKIFMRKIFSNRLRATITIVLLLGSGFFGWQKLNAQTAKPQYQTAQAERGSLISSITASGSITAGNSVNITTGATGVVSNVYVKNGDSVIQGQKLADITLDQASQAKQASAWASYLSAKSNLDIAKAKINSLQAAGFKANQAFINDAVARGLATNDPTYIQQNALWLQAEADYKNQNGAVAASQAVLNSAWLAYSQISSIVTAPTSGTITNFTLVPGSVIASSVQPSTSSESSSASTSLGTISLEQSSLATTVNLSEIDVVNLKVGQKATLTLDAFPGKTFTGRVSAINTAGTVSSGVTTYPTTITIDSALSNIYPNMAVSATIITDVKNNALLIPSTAIQNNNGQSSVRVMRNGQNTSVPVEVGSSNDTQTEITSGINEGDTVITGQTGGTARRTGGTQGTSPFGAFGGGRGFGGGGAIFRGGGGGEGH